MMIVALVASVVCVTTGNVTTCTEQDTRLDGITQMYFDKCMRRVPPTKRADYAGGITNLITYCRGEANINAKEFMEKLDKPTRTVDQNGVQPK